MCGIGSEKDMGHESRRTLQHMDQDLSRAFHGTKVVVVVGVCMEFEEGRAVWGGGGKAGILSRRNSLGKDKVMSSFMPF